MRAGAVHSGTEAVHSETEAVHSRKVLPFKLVYHDGYDLNLGSHVFPSQKYRLIRERLLSDGFADASDFIQPEPALDEDLLLIHQRGWVTRLKMGTLDYLELLKLEIPYSR